MVASGIWACLIPARKTRPVPLSFRCARVADWDRGSSTLTAYIACKAAQLKM
jgi:hypothetical protein